MKIGFIIACHNKIDDLMVHLEMFKYYPFEHQIIIIHTMDYEDKYMEVINKHHHQRIEGYGHYIGPLLCAVAGVRKAHELNLDYVVFRNADDQLFNYNFELTNFNKLKNEGYLCGGYNWLNVETYHDITLNQVYFNIPAFHATADDAEAYFKRSSPEFLCEYKMARWIKKTCSRLNKEFYRLPGREQEPGIGWERKDIYGAFRSKHLQIPIGFWEHLENNNRFFNLEWQLIGSHDIGSRLNYWRKIRSQVSYGKQIERNYHFARFIDAARDRKKSWNLPVALDPLVSPLASKKEPKLISRRIF